MSVNFIWILKISGHIAVVLNSQAKKKVRLKCDIYGRPIWNRAGHYIFAL